MALDIRYPVPAFIELKRLMWAPEPKTETMFTQQFMLDVGITEQKIRQLAQFSGVTLTEAFRRELVKKYPTIEQHWPPVILTPAQVQGIAKRSKTVDEASDLPKVLDMLKSVVSDPHNRYKRAAAVRMLAKRGISIDTRNVRD